MASQYEVEHNIKDNPRRRKTRRVDMATFDAFLDQISTTTEERARESTRLPNSNNQLHEAFTLRTEPHNNPHATPTPVAVATLSSLVQDQFATLASTSDSPENVAFLRQLSEALELSINDPPAEVRGVSHEFLAGLDRVPRKRLADDDCCPICNERYLDDQYTLVVELPCHKSHRFDLECVGPWLQTQGSCPMCRKDFVKKKEKEREVAKDKEDSEEEEDDGMGMYS